jgi:molecular chaperone DnaJ
MNIKYSGLGDNLFTTIPRGDLYVQIAVTPAENFFVQGIDLYSQFRVNCLLAITGGVTTITTLDHKVFELKIPAGTQSGTKFRVPRQGLYQLNSEHRGDLYVEMSVNIPQDLTPEQLELIRTITTQ